MTLDTAATTRQKAYGGVDMKLVRKIRNWGLADNNKQGFGRQLLSCFERDDLQSEEYEDLIEQKLFSLNRAAPNLLYRNHSKQSWDGVLMK